jgi:type II secretion system protein N
MRLKLKISRWQKIAAYVAFSLFVFIFWFWITFPYDATRRRLVSEASAQGYRLEIGRIGPGLMGMSASNLRISKKLDDSSTETATALVIQSASMRPSLFPLGVAFTASSLGGKISGSLGGLLGTSLRLDLNRLNTADVNFKQLSGIDASGRISAHLALDIPSGPAPGPGKAKEPDLSKANGSLSLKAERLVVNGGTLTVPVMGQSMPVELQKIAIGDLDAMVKFDKGQGKVEKLQGKSEDLELLGSGTIKLARQVDYAESNLDLKLKVEPDFQKRLGPIALGLNILPADKDNPGFRTAKITGFLARPNFNPGR